MFLLFAVGVTIALCALLWRVAVYALPVFVAFSVGFWSLSAGAGVAAIVVGLIAGVVSWELAKRTVGLGSRPIRCLVVAFFALPAAYMGFEIVWQISGLGEPAMFRRIAVAGIAAIAAAGTVAARLTERNAHQDVLF